MLQTIAAAQEVDIIHYRFSIQLTDHNDTIQGQAVIRAVIKSPGALKLDLAQLTEDGKGMKVISVEKADDTAAYPFSHKQNQLIIPVTRGIPGDTLVFRVAYKGVPADGLIISKNKFGQRTFFADNWPNRARHWIPCNDRPDDKASVEFLVTAPDYYKVVSNGVRIEETAIDKFTTRTHWKEDIPQATKVMVIGVAPFAVKTYDEKPGGVPVSAWVYPKDSTKGFYDYGLTPEILRFFSDYIGPYPYLKLANVQSTTVFGGMENASAIFYAEGSVTGNRSEEDLMAHEIAHQWFGDAVSEKSFAHLWLSEGFATFLTNYYFEKRYGWEVARERWEKAREEVAGFAKYSQQPVVDSTKDLMSLLNPNSYNKGAWVLQMLRNEVGDKSFQKIIQTYYQHNKGGNAETNDLKGIAENISGRNLSWFFDQWLHRPGIPVVSVKSYWEKEILTLTITQLQGAHFQFPLEFLVEGEDGRQLRIKETITSGKQFSRHNVAFRIKKITVDPDSKLLFRNVSKN